MDSNTIHSIVLQVLRWAHFFFGIAWIGHLYYFNFVQGHAEKALAADQKKIVVPNFRGRAMWWFRMGAMVTLLTGLAYILYEQLIATDQRFAGWFTTSRGLWITFGAGLGTIMWFNVWFVIWPRQKVIISAVGGLTAKPGDFDAMVAAAGKFSRINTYLSVPMLFGMGARQHFPTTLTATFISMAVVFVVGFGAAYHVVNGAASKVGTEFLPPAAPAAAPAAPPPAAPPAPPAAQ